MKQPQPFQMPARIFAAGAGPAIPEVEVTAMIEIPEIIAAIGRLNVSASRSLLPDHRCTILRLIKPLSIP
jgi:hypothetical protein